MGAWLVHYEIGGQQLTDYWFYDHRRWVFDLVLSNPDAVKLYRMSPQQYASALGCSHRFTPRAKERRELVWFGAVEAVDAILREDVR